MIDPDPYIYAVLIDDAADDDIRIIGVHTLQEPKILSCGSWVSARQFIFSDRVELGVELDCSPSGELSRLIWPIGERVEEFDLEDFPTFHSDQDVLVWADGYVLGFF